MKLSGLGYLSDFDYRSALSVAANLTDALFRLIAYGGHFVGLDISLDNLGRHLGFGNHRGADGHAVAVDNQKWLKIDGCRLAVEQFDVKGITLADDILFAAGGYNCFFHIR